MQLLIPEQQAIKILTERLNDLNSNSFNYKVWKSRTVLDLKQIFGPLGDPWLQVSYIDFDTIINSEKSKKLSEGRDTAKGLLNSYIDIIKEYSNTSNKAVLINEQNYQQQYSTLLGKWNKFVPEYNSLLEKHELQCVELEVLANNLKLSETKNQTLKAGIVKSQRNIYFFIALVTFSFLLWTFNSVIKWEWLSLHPKKISLYISFQLLIIFSSLRIITSNKTIKIVDILIAIMIAILSII
jgi:hypothetical protein